MREKEQKQRLAGGLGLDVPRDDYSFLRCSVIANTVSMRQAPFNGKKFVAAAARRKESAMQGALYAAEERHRIIALELQRSWKERDEVRRTSTDQ